MAKSNALSFSFQSITLIVLTLGIFLLVSLQLKKFCAIDAQPPLIPITPKTMSSFAQKPAPVTVGITITDFPEFKVASNTFVMRGIIWFRFDPSLISLSTVEQFSFVKGTLDYRSPALTQLDGDMVIARYDIKATFRTDLYYGFFPFEDHTLYFMLTNATVSPDEMLFDSSYADVLVDNPSVNGWTFDDHRVTVGYQRIPFGGTLSKKAITHPVVLVALDFFQDSIRYIFTIFLPLLIIFYITMFSFCFDQVEEHSTLVSLTTANIAALVTYRFIIETMTPPVGYPTIADHLYFLFLTITFLTFLINSVGPYLTIFQKKIVSITIQVLVFLAILYLLFFWIPC